MAGSSRLGLRRRRSPLRLLTTMALLSALSGTVIGSATTALAWTTTAIRVAGSCAGSGSNQLNRPNAVALDTSGNLFIADTYNGRVQRVSSSGAVSVAPGGNQISRPMGVAVDGFGNLYVSDAVNDRVVKIDAITGTLTLVAGGNGEGDRPEQLRDPIGIVVDEGELYVADSGNHRVQLWYLGDPTFRGYTVAGTSGVSGTDDLHLNTPTGVALDANLNIFVADSGNNRVQQFPPSWQFVPGQTGGRTVAGNSDGRPGERDNELRSPRGVDIDALGALYIADTGNHRVQKLLANGAFSTVAGGRQGAGPDAGQLWNPVSLDVDVSGNLLIADRDNDRIQKWTPSGSASTLLGSCPGAAGSLSHQLNSPFDTAVDGSGNVYVADTLNNRVQRWAPGAAEGTTVAGSSSGVAGNTMTLLNGPRSVAIDSAGNLFIADTGNQRVVKLAPYAMSFTTVASGVSSPSGLALDAAGNLYVADTGNNRVARFGPTSTTGTTVAGGAGAGSALTQLRSPLGVAVLAGNLYVADTGNHRVVRWALASPPSTGGAGVVVAGTGSSGSNAGQLSAPSDIVVDPAGYLYVSDTSNNRVQKFPPTTTGGVLGVSILGGSGIGVGMTSLSTPRGLGRDSFGNVFVADQLNRRVQEWIGTPNAPTSASAVVSGGISVVVSFVAGDPGGSTPTYTVSCSSTTGGVSRTASGSGSPITVPNLQAPHTYACTVVARNLAGVSPTSAATAQFQTYVVPPSTPTIGSATLGSNGNSAIVTFTPGTSDGGATPIYTVSCSSTTGGATRTASGSGSPVTVSSLDAPHAYACRVTASNSAGSSAPSGFSNNVVTVLRLPPGKPTMVSAQVRLGNVATVTFSPGSPGYSTPTYTVTCMSQNGGQTWQASGSGSPIDVANLSVSLTAVPYSYTCTVVATNSIGSSPTSDPSNTIYTYAVRVPDPPQTPTARRIDFNSMLVATSGSPYAGTAPITSYTFTSLTGGGTCTAIAPKLSCEISGLEAGVPYQFQAQATSADGISGKSAASNAVTAVGRRFIGMASSSAATVLDLPTMNEAIPAYARLVFYVATDTDRVTASYPQFVVNIVTPNSATLQSFCGQTSGAVLLRGASSTPATGVGANIVQCRLTTEIPAGSYFRVTFKWYVPTGGSAYPRSAVVMAEWFYGGSAMSLIGSNIVTPKSGVGGTPTSWQSGVTNWAPEDFAVGAIAVEKGGSVNPLGPDSDLAGSLPWRTNPTDMWACVGPADDTGVCIVRQYKFYTVKESLTYDSPTSLLSSMDWLAFLWRFGGSGGGLY